jgi:UTP--glucose-1-phosphate uridylyltransferase
MADSLSPEAADGRGRTLEPGSPQQRADRAPSASAFKQQMIGKQSKTLGAALTELKESAVTPGETEVAGRLGMYQTLFDQYLNEKEDMIEWAKISPPPEGMVKPLSDLPAVKHDANFHAAVSKLAVVKLNGGLGTSMGCKGPKSVITVRDGLTFLDMTVLQVEYLASSYVDVPLVLMNSFNTDKDTKKVLAKYEGRSLTVKSFNQSQFPRLLKDTLQPAPVDYSTKDEWYPPGHGDIYRSLSDSGILDTLIAQGKEYLFVSNIDNLGSVINYEILQAFAADDGCEFIMEVTDKTRADVKGGTLIEYEGKMRLLELAQVPKEHVDDFKSITTFKIFNTNNLWIKLSAIKRLVDAGKMHMEVIENSKKLDDGTPVIQLEQAVGSAIKNFNGAIGINVPRSRFLPVKQCQDLMLVMSNLFELDQGRLTLSRNRLFPSLPLVKLGSTFKKVDDFLGRFETIPNIIDLDHLTVSGDVNFGRGVVLRGTVIIIANEGERIDIPAGSTLENKIVTG